MLLWRNAQFLANIVKIKNCAADRNFDQWVVQEICFNGWSWTYWNQQLLYKYSYIGETAPKAIRRTLFDRWNYTQSYWMNLWDVSAIVKKMLNGSHFPSSPWSQLLYLSTPIKQHTYNAQHYVRKRMKSTSSVNSAYRIHLDTAILFELRDESAHSILATG